jgi:hypothetical protein
VFWRELPLSSTGPVLRRSTLFTERWERPFAFPMEERCFFAAVEALVAGRPFACLPRELVPDFIIGGHNTGAKTPPMINLPRWNAGTIGLCL